jgi:hypothetical protein
MFLKNQYGKFYMDPENTHNQSPVFTGQLEVIDEIVRIKILHCKKFIKYGGHLYAHLRDSKNYASTTSWSFFECRLDTNEEYVGFSISVKHDNRNCNSEVSFPTKNRPDFITRSSTFPKISVKMEGLDKWLWDQCLKLDPKFQIRFTDQSGHPCDFWNCHNGELFHYNESISDIVIPAHTVHIVVHISETIDIEIHSVPFVFSEYPDCKVTQDCWINVVAKENQSIDSFLEIIDKISLYFSIIGIGRCRIQRIYYSEKTKKSFELLEFYKNRMRWTFTNKEYREWYPFFKMHYQNMREDFSSSIKQFFEQFDILSDIVEFLVSINKKEISQISVSQQIGIIEIYGNIKLGGNYKRKGPLETKQDLDKVVSLIPDEVFDKIFIHNYHDNDLRGQNIFGYDQVDKTIDDMKNRLLTILMDLRNFVVHRYKNGRRKNRSNTELPMSYWLDDNNLNLEAIRPLSSSLNMMLRWILYKEIGLDQYFEI